MYLIVDEHPDEYLLAGFAGNPRMDGEELLLDVGPYVVFSFRSGESLRSSASFRGLRVGPRSSVTRRLHTYRRRVLKHRQLDEGLQEYFELAKALVDSAPQGGLP